MPVQASMAPPLTKNLNNFLIALFTFFLVNVTWVFFRAPDFRAAWRMLTAMFGRTAKGVALLPDIDVIKVTTVIVLMLVFHWCMRNTSVLAVAQKTKWWIVGLVWSFFIIAIIISQKSGDSFIYFQF